MHATPRVYGNILGTTLLLSSKPSVELGADGLGTAASRISYMCPKLFGGMTAWQSSSYSWSSHEVGDTRLVARVAG